MIWFSLGVLNDQGLYESTYNHFLISSIHSTSTFSVMHIQCPRQFGLRMRRKQTTLLSLLIVPRWVMRLSTANGIWCWSTFEPWNRFPVGDGISWTLIDRTDQFLGPDRVRHSY